MLIVFFLLVGLSAGAFTASKLPTADKTDAASYLSILFDAVKQSQLDFFNVFYHAVLQNGCFFAIIIIFSFWTLTIPLILISESVKGFYIGFAIGLLTLEYSLHSFILVITVVMLPNLIILPCFIKAGVLGIRNTLDVFKNRNIPSTSKDKFIHSKPYLFKTLKIFLISLLGVLIQTLLTPLLIKVV